MESIKGRITINYCGGWGYFSRAYAFQEAIENFYPNTFTFKLVRDASTTGRLEVTVWVLKY